MMASSTGGQSNRSYGARRHRLGLHLVTEVESVGTPAGAEPRSTVPPLQGELDYDELAATLLAQVVSQVASQRTGETSAQVLRIDQLCRENRALREEIDRLRQASAHPRSSGDATKPIGPQPDAGRGHA